MDSVLSLDKFFISQKMLAAGRKYHVFDEAGTRLLYIEQAAFVQLKLAFVAYQDESKRCAFFSFRRAKVFARDYHLMDENERPIGKIEGSQLCDVSGRVLACTRRVAEVTKKGLLILKFFTADGKLIGQMTHGWGQMTHGWIAVRQAILDLTDDPNRELDRRFAICAGIDEFMQYAEW